MGANIKTDIFDDMISINEGEDDGGEENLKTNEGLTLSRTTSRDSIALQWNSNKPMWKYSKDFLFLYGSHFLSAFGDRTWEFAVPIFLIQIWKNSWLHGSIFQLVVYSSSFVMLPFAGSYMDNNERLVVLKNITIIQNISTVMICVFLILLVSVSESTPRTQITIMVEWGFFSLMLIFGVIAEVTSQMSTIALERDWIVVLAQNNQDLLTDVNPVIRRLDLVCKLVSPLVFAGIQGCFDIEKEKITYGCTYIIGYNILSLFPQYGLAKLSYKNNINLQKPKEFLEKSELEDSTDDDEEENKRINGTFFSKKASSLFLDWKIYFTHEVFWASFSFSLLFFTVLDNGFLMTSYLEFTKFDLRLLATSRGVCAFFGLAGTVIYKPVTKCFQGSHEKTGILSCWFFFCLISPCVVAFWFDWYPGYVIVILVTISRSGLWMFDLSNVMLLQTHVIERERGKINACQTSMFQIFYVILYTITVFLDKPTYFSILANISVGSVFVSCLIFSIWGITRMKQQQQQQQQIDCTNEETPLLTT